MRKLYLPLALLALILAACAEAPTPVRPTITPIPSRPAPTTAELVVTDPDTTLQVMVGNEFTITVKTNLSIDYHWGIAEELDSRIVEYVWKDHVADNPDAGISSGKDVWRFKAVGPGTTSIFLGYYLGMTDYASQKPIFTVVVK